MLNTLNNDSLTIEIDKNIIELSNQYKKIIATHYKKLKPKNNVDLIGNIYLAINLSFHEFSTKFDLDIQYIFENNIQEKILNLNQLFLFSLLMISSKPDSLALGSIVSYNKDDSRNKINLCFITCSLLLEF